MDEVSRTLDVYESESDAYVEKYTAESVAALYGDDFFEALETVQTGDTARVLDIGCGPGPDAETFASAGHDVTGLDITQSFLRDGVERVPEAAFVRGDMRSLPFGSDRFDGIWACASFHHVPRSHARETLRDCRRVLQPEGYLSVIVKRDEQMDDDDTDRHFEYYGRDEFRSVLDSAGFEPVAFETQGKWLRTLVGY